MITLTIPNDDHIALRAFGKALEEMALAHGAEPVQLRTHCSVTMNDEQNDQLNTLLRGEQTVPFVSHTHGEIDTISQQLESLAVPGATHIISEQKLLGDPEPVGDGNFSQGYIATVEEIADPVDSTGTPWDERIHSTSKALNGDGTWCLRRKPKDMDEAEWAAFVETVKTELTWKKCDPEVLEQMVDAGMDNSGEPQYDGEQHPANLNHVSIDPAHDKGDETAELTIEPPTEDLCVDEGCDHHGTPHVCVTLEPPVTPPGDDFHTDSDVVSEQTVAGIPPLPVPPPVVVAPPVPVQAALSEGIARYGDAMSEIAKNDGDVQWDFPRLMTFLTERHGKIDVTTVNTLLAQDGLASLQELNVHPDKIDPFVARVKAHLGE